MNHADFNLKHSKSINNKAVGSALVQRCDTYNSICRMPEGERIESVQSFAIEIKS